MSHSDSCGQGEEWAFFLLVVIKPGKIHSVLRTLEGFVNCVLGFLELY